MDVPDTAFDMCGKKGIADVKAADAKGSFVGSMGQNYGAAAGDRRRLPGCRDEILPRRDQDVRHRRDGARQGAEQRQISSAKPSPLARGRPGGRGWHDQHRGADCAFRTPIAIDVARGLAKLAAAARAGAVLPAGLSVRPTGFNLWTLFLSFTNSKGFASTKLIGWANYEKLWNWTFERDPPSGWYTALVNMGIFGGLYIVFCLALGLTLAILLDQKFAAKAFCGRYLSLPARAIVHRDRHGLEAFSGPAHRARKSRA